MKLLARFSDVHGDWLGADPDGTIPIIFEGGYLHVRPKTDMGRVWTPSWEFAQKYGAYFYVVLEKTEAATFVWTGLAQVETLPESLSSDPEFSDYVSKYPYVRMEFTENWRLLFDDSASANKMRITHTDGTQIAIDRTPGSESVTISESKHGTTITLDPSGNVVVNVTSGNIYLGGTQSQQLATKEFVENVFNNHAHTITGLITSDFKTVSQGMGPSVITQAPVSPSPLVPGADITEVVYGR